MELTQWIITAGSVVSALVLIYKTTIAILKFLEKKTEDDKELHEAITDLKKYAKENHLSCLKLTVMNSEIPIGERICAGVKYIKEGGNGEIKKYLINELHINDVLDD